MYDTIKSGKKTVYNSESKYVADILSSMANGAPAALAYSLPAYVSGVATVTTPTLTPTTLANLEQTFIELQSVPVSTPTQDPLTQSGFVPPVVHPNSDPNSSSSDGEGYDYDSSQDSNDWSEPSIKRARSSLPGTVMAIADGPFSNIGGEVRRKTGRGRRHMKDESLTPDELQRREVRRERNKVAAAKCRQRRVDHTNRLIGETEKLEDEKSNLETEITSLQQQKDQLQFILQAHQPVCKVGAATAHVSLGDRSPVKHEYRVLADSPHSVVNLAPVSSLDNSPVLTTGHVITNGHLNSAMPVTSIKQEVLDYNEYGNQSHIIKATESMINRPNSLALSSSGSLSSFTDTPSVFLTSPSFFAGLDSIVDVSSGLTPITSGPSCRSQLHRDSGDSSPEAMGPSTLISL